MEPKSPNADKAKQLANPLIHSIVSCPVCKYNEIHHYTLKAKTLSYKQNVFNVPIYVDTPKFELIDYNELIFSVCPRCFFTGAKKQDFTYTESFSGKTFKSNVSPNILHYWSEKKNEVTDLFAGKMPEEKSLVFPRIGEAVLATCKLGIYRTGIELQFKVPFSTLRRAKFYLLQYYIHGKVYREDNKEILKLAVKDLEAAFSASDFPESSTEYEICYLVAAIYMCLEEDNKASGYLKVLDQTKMKLAQKAKTEPRINLGEIEKWVSKTKNLLQDRKDPSIWNPLKPY